MAARLLMAGLAAAACLLTVGEVSAQSRPSIYPRESQSIYPRPIYPRQGCSSTSRINPCTTRRVPSPVGDPTAGPLTDSIRRGPLDRPLDPLGLDAELPTIPPEVRSQSLPSQKD